MMIGNSWDLVLKDIFESDKYTNLMEFLNSEYNERIIYPTFDNIYTALKLTDFNDVKVVIIVSTCSFVRFSCFSYKMF